MKLKNNVKSVKDWELIRLSVLLEEKIERNIKNLELPVYSISNIHGFILSDEYFNKRVYSKKLNMYKIVETNDFAYNPARINVGSIGLFNNKKAGLVSPVYTVFRIKNKNCLSPEFLFLLLKTKKYTNLIRDISSSRGSIRKILSFIDLKDFQIMLPAISEQKKIIYVLESIQEVVIIQKKLVELVKELKKTIIKKIFSEGLKKEEQKETEIGMIPRSWKINKLEDLIEKIEQKDPSFDPEKNIKYIDVSSISNNVFRIVENKSFLGKNAPSRARKVIKTNDIIFATVRPYLKRIAIVPELYNNEYCSTAFCVIRCNKSKLNPFFLFYYVTTNKFVSKVSSNQRGTGYPAVIDKDILIQMIPFPSLEEQKEIVEILQTIDQKIEIEQKKKELYEELFRSVLDKLMSGEIRINNLDF